MTAGVIPLDRGGVFKFGNFENRKGAAKPRPLCTPLGLFLSSARDSLFLFVDLCLYSSVFSALRCADVVLFLLFLCGSLPARCLYASVFSALRCADVVLFLLFLCGSLSARCLYSSILSAPCCADVVLFLHFLCGSLLARCLYSSVFSAPYCADIISFLHFLCDSLLAKCPYSSMLSALRVAISRFESQPSRGRSVSPPAACLPSPSLHQPKYHIHHYLPAIQRSADGPKPPEQPPNLSQPNNQPGSHPKPQHHNIHNIHTIRYNSKTSSV